MYAFKGKCFETFTVASGGCIWWWLVIVIEIVDQVTWGVVFNFLVIWTVSDAVMWCVSCWSMIGLKQRWFILGGGKRNEHSKNTPGRSGQYAYQGEWVIMTFCSKKIKAGWTRVCISPAALNTLQQWRAIFGWRKCRQSSLVLIGCPDFRSGGKLTYLSV